MDEKTTWKVTDNDGGGALPQNETELAFLDLTWRNAYNFKKWHLDWCNSNYWAKRIWSLWETMSAVMWSTHLNYMVFTFPQNYVVSCKHVSVFIWIYIYKRCNPWLVLAVFCIHCPPNHQITTSVDVLNSNFQMFNSELYEYLVIPGSD